MRVYTRKGDEGETGLLFGGRASKADERFDAAGAVDTAVSAMGLARALCANDRTKDVLLQAQHDMFTIGSELATGPEHYDELKERFSIVTAEMVERLEATIDEIDRQIDLPHNFIVPGASAGSSALDLARGLVREAERRTVAFNGAIRLPNGEVLRYLNRLSDLLFMLARLEDKDLSFEITTGKIRREQS